MIRGKVVQIYNEKTGKGTMSKPLQKLHALDITPERDDNEPPPATNNVEIQESKSLIDFDSAEGNLGGSDGGGRTKIRQYAALDGDMKQRLL